MGVKFVNQGIFFVASLISLFIVAVVFYQMPQVAFTRMLMASQKSKDSGRSSPLQILLITFGRSGSTFTSALISHHSDVFYVFEPLYSLVQKGNVTTIAKSHFVNTSPVESLSLVRAFLTCELKSKHLYALENRQHRNSVSTLPVYQCVRQKASAIHHMRCFLDFLNKCKHSTTTFVKTIRFRMEWAEGLLKTLPNLKILYLMRDPRAVMFSQARVFRSFDWHLQTHVQNVSSVHCQDIESDLNAYDRLNQLYPGRIKGIRYEHGAVDPVGFSRDIYEFLGLTFTKSDESFVGTLTRAPKGLIGNNSYSIFKANSTQAMHMWRSAAGLESVKTVDRVCSRLYSRLGYKVVQSEKHLVSNISLVTMPDRGGLFDT